MAIVGLSELCIIFDGPSNVGLEIETGTMVSGVGSRIEGQAMWAMLVEPWLVSSIVAEHNGSLGTYLQLVSSTVLRNWSVY